MSISNQAFVGINLAIAKGKPLPVVFCVWEEDRCIPLPIRDLGIESPRGHGNAALLDRKFTSDFIREAAAFLSAIAFGFGISIGRIAIDAPSAPAQASGKRRGAEAVLDQRVISCFSTPNRVDFDRILDKVRHHLDTGGAQPRIPHANQLWMVVGFELFRRLSRLAPSLEVYPQLTVRGSQAQDEARRCTGTTPCSGSLYGLVPGDPGLHQVGYGSSHYQLDAYLAAWVAALPEERRIALCMPPGDAIWAPFILGASCKVSRH